MTRAGYRCGICHETFRSPKFATRCEAQGVPTGPFQLGDLIWTTTEAGRLLTVVEIKVHHGLGKCPVDGPCEHAVSYQLSLLYSTHWGRERVWVACLGRLPNGYVPRDATRIGTLTRPDNLPWGVISDKGPPELYLAGPRIEEAWRRVWEMWPSHPSKFYDTDWPNKIAKAKEARRAGQLARKGKSATFSNPQLGGGVYESLSSHI